MDRIRLAREFDIPSWEEPAYLELCERDEPLTMVEAEVLGLKVVLYVGVVRERELRRKLKEVEVIAEVVRREEEGRQRTAEEPAMTATREGGSIQTTLSLGSDEETGLVPLLATEPAPDSTLDPVLVPEPVQTQELGQD